MTLFLLAEGNELLMNCHQPLTTFAARRLYKQGPREDLTHIAVAEIIRKPHSAPSQSHASK